MKVPETYAVGMVPKSAPFVAERWWDALNESKVASLGNIQNGTSVVISVITIQVSGDSNTLVKIFSQDVLDEGEDEGKEA